MLEVEGDHSHTSLEAPRKSKQSRHNANQELPKRLHQCLNAIDLALLSILTSPEDANLDFVLQNYLARVPWSNPFTNSRSLICLSSH